VGGAAGGRVCLPRAPGARAPTTIEVEPLFPPGTAFARLTHLEIGDYEREHPPDAGVMGLWELMASGGLPALAKLKVSSRAVGGGRR
jgi:hypothetical protein